MKTRIVFQESHLDQLRSLVFDRPGIEGAAFLLCGEARSADCMKLISQAVVPIDPAAFLRREHDGLSISSSALARISKLARYEGLSVIFAHSHPEGVSHFSAQDDREEERLIPFLQARVPDRIHGTVVLTHDAIVGRIYGPARIPVEAVLSIGDRVRNWTPRLAGGNAEFFDRQVRAFGTGVQSALGELHIGVVGLGGTGSAVAEFLCRLGVGQLSLFDGDDLEQTNVNRVLGSTVDDAGTAKVIVAKRHLDAIGLGTAVLAHAEHITDEGAASLLRGCDVVFGCTDRQRPRAILTTLALRYCIPVFDMGVLISSVRGEIVGVNGRVTTLMHGESCLFCRGRISVEGIRVESLSAEERTSQAQEGYAPELTAPAPAVVTFTSSVAGAAVNELMHRLCGFMGRDRRSSEVLVAFDQSRLRTNRVESREGCMCSDRSIWGRGDCRPFLDMLWA
jgi:molybdopterin/thiamine biosynthesis adenylyltransferase